MQCNNVSNQINTHTQNQVVMKILPILMLKWGEHVFIGCIEILESLFCKYTPMLVVHFRRPGEAVNATHFLSSCIWILSKVGDTRF